MTHDPVVELRQEYNADETYFQTLSDWFTSGQLKRRTAPLLRHLRPYLHPQARVLDAGCAAGAMAIEIAQAGVQQVDAVDFSSTALRFARENALQFRVADRIRFIESPVEQLDGLANDTYDVIVAADVIEHISVPAVFVAEMWRVCKPRGVMLIETPNPSFRGHAWYRHADRLCHCLHLPESRNLFPVNTEHNWGRYHVSMLGWAELTRILDSQQWRVIKRRPFGWWLQLGAADRITKLSCIVGACFYPKLLHYTDTDVLMIAQKATS